MKVAARFPIKRFPLMARFIVSLHLFLLLISGYQFGFSWQQWLVIPSLFISLFFCLAQYQKITQSMDDLCWSGQSWLIHRGDKLSGAIYLELNQTSWISSQVSLLHFSNGEQRFYWLFARQQLGQRMYSELLYLVNQDLKQQLKPER